MNRRQGAEDYLRLIDKIRGALSGAVIRSTFLVGFPGETDEDFAALLNFQQKAAIDWLGVFSYSREEDTPAYTMKERVIKKTAAARKNALETAQIPLSEARQQRFVGQTLTVLVEEVFLNESDGESNEMYEMSNDNDGVPDENSDRRNSDRWNSGLYLGRIYAQAPEVDGAVILSSDQALAPGTFVRATISGRAGFDLQAGV
jgi:ribosomal protein S12 methylthiotransferase